MLKLEFLEGRICPTSWTFTGAVDHEWCRAANWSGGTGYPNSGSDNVDLGGMVVYYQNWGGNTVSGVIGSLTSGGNDGLALDRDLEVDGTFDWGSNGTPILSMNGHDLTLVGDSYWWDGTLGDVYTGGTVRVQGDMYAAPSVTLELDGNVVVHNGGSWMQDGGNLNCNLGGIFSVYGTLDFYSASGSHYFLTPPDNTVSPVLTIYSTGVVTVHDGCNYNCGGSVVSYGGTLSLDGTSNGTSFSITGVKSITTPVVATGSLLMVSGSTLNLTSGSSSSANLFTNDNVLIDSSSFYNNGSNYNFIGAVGKTFNLNDASLHISDGTNLGALYSYSQVLITGDSTVYVTCQKDSNDCSVFVSGSTFTIDGSATLNVDLVGSGAVGTYDVLFYTGITGGFGTVTSLTDSYGGSVLTLS